MNGNGLSMYYVRALYARRDRTAQWKSVVLATSEDSARDRFMERHGDYVQRYGMYVRVDKIDGDMYDWH